MAIDVTRIPLTWRLLRDPPLPGPRNMALDHALAACLGDGEAVLRLYGWSRPTISFGRNEPARALYGGPLEAGTAGFVRRPTGGRAVVHGRELTYAVVAPPEAWGGPRAAYTAVNAALAAAVRVLGAAAEVVGRPDGAARRGGSGFGSSVLPPDAGPCFRSPAPGEVVAAGRKLVGSAQARLEGTLLQHGSVLLEDDQGLLDGLHAAGAEGPPSGQRADRPATLRELVGDVSIDHVMDAVAMSLRETFGGEWLEDGWSAAEIEAAERLEAERYSLDSWTWRR